MEERKHLPLNLQMFAEEPASEGQASEEAQAEQEQKPESTFTQADLTRVGKKEHEKGQAKVLKALGFEDLETARQAVEQFKSYQESQKTEAEKQAETLTAKEKELEEVKAQLADLQARNEAITAGVKADAVADVITLARGAVSDEVSMADAIKGVLDKYPQFKQGAEPSKPSVAKGNRVNAGAVKLTAEEFGKLNYLERLALKQSDPETYKQYTGGNK